MRKTLTVTALNFCPSLNRHSSWTFHRRRSRLVNKAIYLITWQLIWVLKYVITCVPLFSLIQIFLPRLVNKAIYLITWQLIWVLKYVITCVPLFSLIQIFLPRKSKLDYPVFYFVVVVLPITFIDYYYWNSCGILLLKVFQ